MTYLVSNSSKYVLQFKITTYMIVLLVLIIAAINSSYQLNYCVSIKSSVSTETARLSWLAGVIDVDFIKPRIVSNSLLSYPYSKKCINSTKV
jgi:hypothetical protein